MKFLPLNYYYYFLISNEITNNVQFSDIFRTIMRYQTKREIQKLMTSLSALPFEKKKKRFYKWNNLKYLFVT